MRSYVISEVGPRGKSRSTLITARFESIRGPDFGHDFGHDFGPLTLGQGATALGPPRVVQGLFDLQLPPPVVGRPLEPLDLECVLFCPM